MPELLTRDFGAVPYTEEEVFDFPLGLPGFPACRRFLPLRAGADETWVVLQSLDRREVAFLALPVETLVEDYRLRMVDPDRVALGPLAGGLRTLAVVSLPPAGPATVNLLGPLVLNPATRKGVQAVRDDRRYSAAEPVEPLLARQRGTREAVCW